MFARENFRDVGKKISDWKREWLFWKVSIMLGKYFFDLQEKLFLKFITLKNTISFKSSQVALIIDILIHFIHTY